MPTPARLATASRLASAPPALNTALAASSTRSRLRTASARGFRTIAAGRAVISFYLVVLDPLVNGGFLHISRRALHPDAAADRFSAAVRCRPVSYTHLRAHETG